MSDLLIHFLTAGKQVLDKISSLIIKDQPSSSDNKPLGEILKSGRIHLVMGNESCDMDSTISSIILAYGLKINNPLDILVIPVLNTKEREFPLRTETCYLLKEQKIPFEILIFKEHVPFNYLIQKHQETVIDLTISVVDHHVLGENDKFLNNFITQIFDHRPINAKEKIKNQLIIEEHIERVGSCSTLIAEYLLLKKKLDLGPELIRLIYSTIIYDTIVLDEACGRTSQKDVEIVKLLEKILHKSERDRQICFDLLWKVHNDISGIKPKDLLCRDLKRVRNVVIPGLPLLVKDYLKLPEVSAALENFMKEFKEVTDMVLVGIQVEGQVQRDIGIYSPAPNKFSQFLIKTLSENAELQLKQESVEVGNVTYFKQENIKPTRKFILPLVIKAIENFKS